jgi:uncharacterized protein YkwD
VKKGAIAIIASAPFLYSAHDSRADGDVRLREPPWSFASESASPRASRGSEDDRTLEAVCGTPEGGLHTVAERLLDRKAKNLPYLDLDGLSFAQRVAGEPHVWPRAFILSGPALDMTAAKGKLSAWRASFGDIGDRRCGLVSRTLPDGTQIIAAMALDALADLAPIPTRGRTGEWITVDATLLVPASGAEVVVMAPRGAPYTVPASKNGNKVRARFALSSPGAFVVQVLATIASGPRPVLEANVYADVAPPTTTPNLSAPGEEAGANAQGRDALYRMVDALRAAESLRPLKHDARLEDLARAHALKMKASHKVGHAVGDGDPTQRVQDANMFARTVGENVAHAESVVNAHRALYASPSHRENLLRNDYQSAGFAVVEGDDGSAWVCEMFADGLQ